MRIETQRLYLRPYLPSDLDEAFAVLGDAETMAFYRRPYTPAEVATILTKNAATFASAGYGLLALHELATDRYVGDCGITVQWIDGEEALEIGYHLAREQWGRGYAPEAAAAIRDYGFNVLQLPKLYSYMPRHHHQSRRVAEKIGMTLEKEFRNPRNRNLPTVVYSLIRPPAIAAQPLA